MINSIGPELWILNIVEKTTFLNDILHSIVTFTYKGPIKKYVLNFWTILDHSLPACVNILHFPLFLLAKYVLIASAQCVMHWHFRAFVGETELLCLHQYTCPWQKLFNEIDPWSQARKIQKNQGVSNIYVFEYPYMSIRSYLAYLYCHIFHLHKLVDEIYSGF